MAERSRDWLNQALRDFEKKLDYQNGYYERCCFTVYQACEKALKSLYYMYDLDVRGNSIRGNSSPCRNA